MSYRSHAFVVAALGLGFGALLSGPARATMVLSYEQTSSGVTGSGAGVSYSVLPVTDTYGNSSTNDSAFAHPTTPFFTDPKTGASFGFYDDFLFTVGPGRVDSITSSIDFSNVLGINNLQTRLYNASGQSTLPVLGAPAGGAIDAWSNTFSISPGTTETVSVLPQTTLAAGTYVLEVRGNLVGANGGSYSGTLQLTPVPLPAALALLLSGLGVLGRFGRRSIEPARA